MNTNQINNETKESFAKDLEVIANKLGGVNNFLSMIEDLRAAKPSGLLNKTSVCHYKEGTISWNKTIYADTLAVLFNAIRKENKDGDLLNGLNPKDYKSTMNMMRTLNPITITVNPKGNEEAKFSFSILDSSEAKKTKVDAMFKIIFFYNTEMAKKLLVPACK